MTYIEHCVQPREIGSRPSPPLAFTSGISVISCSTTNSSLGKRYIEHCVQPREIGSRPSPLVFTSGISVISCSTTNSSLGKRYIEHCVQPREIGSRPSPLAFTSGISVISCSTTNSSLGKTYIEHCVQPREIGSRSSPRAFSSGAEDEDVGAAAAAADGLEEFLLPERVRMLVETEKSPSFFQELEKYAWNPQDCSRNIHFKEEFPLTCFRSTSTGAADAVRGRVGFSQGIHMWAIHWPAELRGLHPMVGVGTKAADLHGNGINSIVGSDDQSWGWNLSTLRLRHDCSMDSADYPVVAPYDDFEVPDSFGEILLDIEIIVHSEDTDDEESSA
ncbi:SPRY domain-containing SOCS box protein 4 [Homalodisca vitripennis]|nr:SPRY domain-containing SOCS box protein 4 [Homalodisca vitripennis]